MRATRQLREAGQSLRVDKHHPHPAQAVHTRRIHRPGLGHRAYFQPDDLRQGHRGRHRLRRRDRHPRAGWRVRRSDEQVFFEHALSDLRRAADLFAPVHQHTDGVDGWVSLEVSPLLAHDDAATIEQATRPHATAHRPSLFIKIPGTPRACPPLRNSPPACHATLPRQVSSCIDRNRCGVGRSGPPASSHDPVSFLALAISFSARLKSAADTFRGHTGGRTLSLAGPLYRATSPISCCWLNRVSACRATPTAEGGAATSAQGNPVGRGRPRRLRGRWHVGWPCAPRCHRR